MLYFCKSAMMRVVKRPSVRFASQIFGSKSSRPRQLILETVKEDRPLSAEEWKELRNKILSSRFGNINKTNIDAIVVQSCQSDMKTTSTPLLNTAKSYIQHLKQSGVEPNLSTLSSFVKLYYDVSNNGIEITNSDQEDIIKM